MHVAEKHLNVSRQLKKSSRELGPVIVVVLMDAYVMDRFVTCPVFKNGISKWANRL